MAPTATSFDSGNNRDSGKRIKKLFDSKGWKLRGIFNTHAHADHIGGNSFLQSSTGCSVMAKGIECAMTRHPILMPTTIYGGFPISELKHKFLLAQESDCQELSPELPCGIKAIDLPGHTFDMVGFRTAEDVVYLGDCLSSAETLEKYKIGVILDVATYLDTLEKVKSMEAAWFVPSHAMATEDIAPLAQLNIDKVVEISDRILEICSEALVFDDILREVFCRFDLKMSFEQHALVGSTVKSYLTWLKESSRIEAFIDDNRLLWRQK